MKKQAWALILLCAALCPQATAESISPHQVRKLFFKKKVRALKKPKRLSKVEKAQFQLGQALFFDKEISGPRNVSCASCHHPYAGTSDDLAFGFGHGAMGIGRFRRGNLGVMTPRNSQALFNLGENGFNQMFWDGRASYDPKMKKFKTTLAELTSGSEMEIKEITKNLNGALALQALLPMANFPELQGWPGMPNEISNAKNVGETWKLIMERLVGNGKEKEGIKEYLNLFKKSFPKVQKVNIAHAANAIAKYEEVAFAATATPFDQFMRGNNKALDKETLKGAKVFATKGKCLSCHSGPHLSDFKYYSLGMQQFGIGARATGLDGVPHFDPTYGDPGRGDFTQERNDRFKFRTPTLRNVALTPPYMHNGAYQSLKDAVLHHLDAKKMAKNFDVNTLPLEEYKLNFENYKINEDENFDQMPEVIKRKIKLSKKEIRALMKFLTVGLTDPNSVNLEKWVPKTVPSGLSVER